MIAHHMTAETLRFLTVPRDLTFAVKGDTRARRGEVIPIASAQLGAFVSIVGVVSKIPEPHPARGNVWRYERGQCLGLRISDNTGEMYCLIQASNFDRLALPIIKRGAANNPVYAVQGRVDEDECNSLVVFEIQFLGSLGETCDFRQLCRIAKIKWRVPEFVR